MTMLPDGNEYKYSNGYSVMIARSIKESDTELYKRTSFEQFESYPNGTTVVTYRNGTIAVFTN